MLTGPKARQRDDIDEEAIQDAWDVLDRAWRDLDGLRQFGAYGIVQMEDIERFIDGWQVSCHRGRDQGGVAHTLLPHVWL